MSPFTCPSRNRKALDLLRLERGAFAPSITDETASLPRDEDGWSFAMKASLVLG